MGGWLGGWLWTVQLGGAWAAPDTFGFSPGEAPVDLDARTAESTWTPAHRCASCHRPEAEQWAQSRHRVSWSNDLMQAGFVAEPRLFCVYCHAPAQAQVDEVVANLPTYRALSPHADPNGPPAPALQPEPHAEEGVTCVVCHLREGAVLSAQPPDPESPHPIRHDPTFGTQAACATCHAFPTPSFVDGVMVPTAQPMQDTVQEWRAWKATTGRAEDCTDCHMPDGSHRMPGAHDQDRVREAVSVSLEPDGSGWLLRVEASDVGHAVPTGDLFRHITVEARAAGDTEWSTLRVLGRRFAVDASGPVPLKQEVADTRLRPGHPVRLELDPALSGGAYRLRMHLGGAHDEARGLVHQSQLVYVLHSGVLP